MVGLAIIDDQSGITFVDPLVKNALKLPRQVLRNSMQGVVTIEGESKAKPCHIVQDLIVTPLDGQPEMVMPPAVMQNRIPDAIDQVPSRRDVANTHGYEDFARHFPEKDTKWPTLLLIGRDCMPAQWQEQYYSEENQEQMVSKTPLGWTLIGFPGSPTTHLLSHPTKTKNSRRGRRDTHRRRNSNRARSSTVNLMTNNPI